MMRLAISTRASSLALVVVLVCLITVGASRAPTSTADAATPDSEFADNTTSVSVRDGGEASVLQTIIGHIKAGYEHFDVRLLEKGLDPGFVLYIGTSSANFGIEKKDAYIRARSGWNPTTKRARDLAISIRHFSYDKKTGLIKVLALTTYKSKYFAPRFLEILSFRRDKENWLLIEQLMLPLHPRKPEQYAVQFFVAEPQWRQFGMHSLQAQFSNLALVNGPDWVIDQAIKNNRDKGFPGDERERVLLFVFREPPKIGSMIAVEHQFSYPDSKKTYKPWRFEYTVERIEPFFIIENRTRSGYPPDAKSNHNITYRVFVDGVKLAEKVVTITKPSGPAWSSRDKVPWPHDVKILAPSGDVPEAYTQFLGIWEGEWEEEDNMTHRIAVEEVDTAGNAVVVYAEGGESWYFERWPARIENGKLRINFEPRFHSIVEYSIDTDGEMYAVESGTETKKVKDTAELERISP